MQKSTLIAILISVSFLLFFWYLVAHSFYDVAIAKQDAFTTDGCTLFMDGSWKQCCFEHDRQYWQGGSAEERLMADVRFRKCIYEINDSGALSFVVYGAVRVGGSPFIAVPWRWGYGWDFGRGYR